MLNEELDLLNFDVKNIDFLVLMLKGLSYTQVLKICDTKDLDSIRAELSKDKYTLDDIITAIKIYKDSRDTSNS